MCKGVLIKKEIKKPKDRPPHPNSKPALVIPVTSGRSGSYQVTF